MNFVILYRGEYMTKSDSLTIVPIYTGKNRIFDGFSVYKNGKQVKKDGKPVLLRLQEDERYYQLDENEDTGPRKGAPNGIYMRSSLAADNDVYAYAVKYGSRTWELSFAEYDRLSQPALVFTAKNESGIFKGYTITQYDETSGKIENRGTVAPENVTYKRRSDGRYACIYNDEQSDGQVVPYYMETISKEEYAQRSVLQGERKNIFREIAQDITKAEVQNFTERNNRSLG